MELNGIPDEYVDTLVQDLAYDPIRLHAEEDPAQVLYDRKTLETIWETKHDAVNPYTRQPFDINRAVPQAELRQQMSHYILENTTLTRGLGVIRDYTNVLTAIDMKILFTELSFDHHDLRFYCSVAIALDKTGRMDEEKYWKTLWKRFNLLRLYCQYRAENRQIFSSIKGYEFLFKVIDEPLLDLCREYYDYCDYAKEVCREVARIIDIVGLEEDELRTLPEISVSAFVHILKDLAQSEYLKIQSMVLRIYRKMFYGNISYLILQCTIFCNCVTSTTLSLLMRHKFLDITNEDLYNGSLILKAAWLKNSSLLSDNEYYVDALVNMEFICISRLKNVHEVGDDEDKNIQLICMALDEALSLINSVVVDYPDDSNRHKERLQSLDIVRDIVRMVQLVLSGFQFMETLHFRFGFNIVKAIYKQGGASVIRKKDIDTFRRFLGSKNVDRYGKHVKTLLQEIVGYADAEYCS